MVDYPRLQDPQTGVTLMASGASSSIASGAMVQATTANLGVLDSPGYGSFDLALKFSLTTFAGVSGYAIRAYSQYLDVDGASEPAPSIDNADHYLGSFQMVEQAASQAHALQGCPRAYTQNESVWIYNGSLVTVNAGWSLVAYPRSDKFVV